MKNKALYLIFSRTCLTGIFLAFSATSWAQYSAGGGSAFGTYAVAIGDGSAAEANYSLALGCWANAAGEYSTAVGIGAYAPAQQGTAIGANSYAGGLWSFAGIGGYAYSPGAIAFGDFSFAVGNNSIAIGLYTTATGVGSVALAGDTTVAEGAYSAALGGQTTAIGDYSAALGRGTVATGPDSCVVGSYNALEYLTYTGHDAIFVIGNGTSETPSNALIVRRDGSVWMKKQGDISMGIFAQ